MSIPIPLLAFMLSAMIATVAALTYLGRLVFRQMDRNKKVDQHDALLFGPEDPTTGLRRPELGLQQRFETHTDALYGRIENGHRLREEGIAFKVDETFSLVHTHKRKLGRVWSVFKWSDDEMFIARLRTELRQEPIVTDEEEPPALTETGRRAALKAAFGNIDTDRDPLDKPATATVRRRALPPGPPIRREEDSDPPKDDE